MFDWSSVAKHSNMRQQEKFIWAVSERALLMEAHWPIDYGIKSTIYSSNFYTAKQCCKVKKMPKPIHSSTHN